MTAWLAFTALTVGLVLVILILARLSTAVINAVDSSSTTETVDETHLDVHGPPDEEHRNLDGPAEIDFSTKELVANVTLSHGVFTVILGLGIYITDIPLPALGIAPDPMSTGWIALWIGIAVGILLSIANTIAGGLTRIFREDPSEHLRELLAPESTSGWIILIGLVLPIIAIFEELLFRAALIGALASGFDISPWILAIVSSGAFAVGHQTQGHLGVIVTGLLGLALAIVFILTNSLLAVIIAHYIVNATEFIVIEGIGWEPFTK